MLVKCQYPVAFRGTPKGHRHGKTIVGSLTGSFELKTTTQDQIHPVLEIRQTITGKDHVRQYFSVDGGFYEASPVPPLVRNPELKFLCKWDDTRNVIFGNRLSDLRKVFRDKSETDMRNEVYPADLRRSLYSTYDYVKPIDLNNISNFSTGPLDWARESIKARFDELLLANDVIYKRLSEPFYEVHGTKAGVVAVKLVWPKSLADFDAHEKTQSNLAGIYSITNREDAILHANDLASQTESTVDIIDADITINDPNALSFNDDAHSLRYVCRQLHQKWVETLWGKSQLSDTLANKLFQLNVDDLGLFQRLHGLCTDPAWQTKLPEMEAMVEYCLKDIEQNRSSRFSSLDETHLPMSKVYERWQFRKIGVDPGQPKLIR